MLLEVKGLRVAAEGREILHGVDLSVDRGETVVLTGKNGAGKSTLGAAVMGVIQKNVEAAVVEEGLRRRERVANMDGEIWFEGEEISGVAIDERARRGIFMSWQAPVEITGVSTMELLRARNATSGPSGKFLSHPELLEICKRLGAEPWSIKRDLNVGFSGGEKKKNELLQMMAIRPKLAILDEVDSGLDREAAKRASHVLKMFQEETGVAYLVITHNRWILEKLTVNRYYEVDSGWMEEVKE